jgi:hypothetical protein
LDFKSHIDLDSNLFFHCWFLFVHTKTLVATINDIANLTLLIKHTMKFEFTKGFKRSHLAPHNSQHKDKHKNETLNTQESTIRICCLKLNCLTL